MIHYVDYAEAHRVSSDELIVVDSHYPRGLVLSHMYEDRVPEHLRANTSTEVVINAIEADELSGRALVTCNHWDIDGFLAVFSAINHKVAIANRALLIAAATLGDFREFDHTSSLGNAALKLCASLNALEAREFCLPFGDTDDASIEHEVARKKFPFFLSRFEEILDDTRSNESLWRKEFDEVMQDITLIQSGGARISEHPAIGLSVVHSERTLHYYALSSCVKGGATLTSISSRPYVEFEYRYETKVGRRDKQVFPRVDLSDLAQQLSELESTPNMHWVFDNIELGGPMLRPESIDRPLSMEERYQSMNYRLERHPALATSIDTNLIEKLIVSALSRC